MTKITETYSQAGTGMTFVLRESDRIRCDANERCCSKSAKKLTLIVSNLIAHYGHFQRENRLLAVASEV